MKPTLTQLAQKYNCDKYWRHSYMTHYDKLVGGREVKRLLEIGIGYEGLMAPFVPQYVHGSSLRMWSEYWPEADICACDIHPHTLINEGRIRSWAVDQSDEHQLQTLINNIGAKLDVIIDDGSHQLEDQRISARVLLPWVNKDGVYIIEDTYPDKGKKLAEEFGGRLIVGPATPDDCLVVIEK